LDTGFLQEEEAHYLGKHRLSKHAQPKALFNQSDVVSALQSFTPQKFMRWIEILPGLEIQFLPAGHILGAAMVLIKCRGQKLLFSGDVGRPHDPLFEPPSNLPADIDVLFLESTYGKHLHPCTDPLDDLSEILKQASANQSVVLIPAFTVGRAQTLLYYLMLLKRRGKVPWMPMYLNSPMALTATKVFCESKDHKLNAVERQEMLDTVRFVETAEESQKLNQRKGPMLIISASGMLTGGRILHHLKSFAGAANNLILLTGYQAEGTRGRALFDGLREIKVHQQLIAVRAEVRLLENLSAHADRNEILAWLEKTPELKPKKVFIVHGEPEASQALKQALDSRFGWDCTVPKLDQQFLLEF
jgi:metallo-beta-lactamase family protein